MQKFCRWMMVGTLAAAHLGAWAVTELAPTHDDEVVEVLPAVGRLRPSIAVVGDQAADATAAALAARQAIETARQSGDTRYWGRAQAVLAPWWDRAVAPTELAILQATVQQGRHEFEASRQVLTAALQRDPAHAQGWLNLATLERLSARYAEALNACASVARAGQAFYAAACRLETLSLQGQHPVALAGLQHLLGQTQSAEQGSWLWSLLAESQERAGHDAAATDAYQRSLALMPDLYTSIAFSDLLLRTGRSSQALQTLAGLPETDAVLLRRATAWRRLGDAQWTPARTLLKQRTAELVRRGDDPALHGRELALIALWLEDDPRQALTLARSNLRLQREPLDWWVALQSAHLAKDSAALAEIGSALESAGLNDTRLAALLPATKGRVARVLQ